MKLPMIALIILNIVVIGGWNISAANASDGEAPVTASAEESVLTTPAKPSEHDFAPPGEDLEPPVQADLEPPPAVEASCHVEDCGSTGTLTGSGYPCTGSGSATADLDSKINAAAYNICPDIVTGIGRSYDPNCAEIVWGVLCERDGSAQIECKICPGQEPCL